MSKELNKALDLLREIRPSIPKDVLELWCKDRDAFLAQRSEFHQHLKECADEVATWPTYKQEALGPFLGHELGIEGETETANELNKAPVEQAGGDERDFQAKGAQEVPSPVSKEYDRHLIGLLRKGEALPGHQEEAADEIERLHDWNDHLNNTVLPNILNPNFLMLMKGGERLLDLCTKDGKFIGVSLNDMKDVFDWMVTHARIAPDQAALAQPSPTLPPFAEKVLAKLRRFYDCASDFESGGVDIGRHWLDLLTQLWLLNRVQRSPALWEISQQGEDLLDTPQPSPAQAEVERPEVVGYLSITGARLLREWGVTSIRREEFTPEACEPLMTVAQHERIVKAWIERWKAYIELSAKIAAQRDAANARLHEVATACATAEQERDAALAEVERLRESKGDPSGSFDRCMKMMYERDENAKRLDAALARVAELETALTPFAAVADAYDDSEDDDHEPYTDMGCDDRLRLTLSQHRAARTALSGAPSQAQHSVPEGWVQSLPLKDHQPCKPNKDRANGYTIPIYSRPVLVEEALRKLRAVLCDPIGNVVIDGSDGDREEVQRALGMLAAAPGKEGNDD